MPHKVILRVAIKTAFSALDGAVSLIAAAYSGVTAAGGGALDETERLIAQLRAVINKLIDDLPG